MPPKKRPSENPETPGKVLQKLARTQDKQETIRRSSIRHRNLLITGLQREYLDSFASLQTLKSQKADSSKIKEAAARLKKAILDKKKFKVLFEDAGITEDMWKDWDPSKKPPPGAGAPPALSGAEKHMRHMQMAGPAMYIQYA